MDFASALTHAPRRTRTRAGHPPPRLRHDVTLLEAALAPVRDDLNLVTTRLLQCLQEPMARRVVYLVVAGGKRLRPALVLLTGALGAAPNQAALRDAAASVELIHTATLIHDDVIDASPLRRRQPAFHARWGTERALLTGDYLYATAFAVLTRLSVPAVMQLMAEACQELSRGELREVEARHRLDVSESLYFAIIRDKTASLIRACCQIGGLLGGASGDVVERLGVFGEHFGMAFQIMDDCLDLVGTQREMGKSILADLDKGALSLPMIYLARRLPARKRAQLFAPLRTRLPDAACLRMLAQAAKESGAIDEAYATAEALCHKAQAALAGIPLNGMAAMYQHLTAYALQRRS